MVMMFRNTLSTYYKLGFAEKKTNSTGGNIYLITFFQLLSFGKKI